MTTLAAVHRVLAPHRYEQRDITDAFARVCLGPDGNHELARRLHANAQVESRHLTLPLDEYEKLADFGAANDAFIANACELAIEAITGALDAAGIRPDEVDLIISTTVTGVAAPSIEARIAQRLGLRPDVKRVPLFGLGCVAGAAGIARAARLPARLAGSGRGAAVGRTLLAHHPAQRPLDREPDRLRPVR